MQYTQRKLHRSVTETRKSRRGRPKESTGRGTLAESVFPRRTSAMVGSRARSGGPPPTSHRPSARGRDQDSAAQVEAFPAVDRWWALGPRAGLRGRFSREAVTRATGSTALTGCRTLRPLLRTAPGDRRDVLGLGTLRPLDDLELDALTFLQALALCSLDAGGVDEQVSPIPPVRGDEPVALALAEPLDDPDRHALAPRPLPDPAASVRPHIPSLPRSASCAPPSRVGGAERQGGPDLPGPADPSRLITTSLNAEARSR